jgi:hypothetical protein
MNKLLFISKEISTIRIEMGIAPIFKRGGKDEDREEFARFPHLLHALPPTWLALKTSHAAQKYAPEAFA